MFAIAATSAIGLTCAGCAGINFMDQRTQGEPSAIYQAYTLADSPDIVRTALADQTPVRTTRVITTRTQFQQSVQTEASPQRTIRTLPTTTFQTEQSSSRPLGEIGGVDVSLAEFAASSSSGDNRFLKSPLDQRFAADLDSRRIDAGYTFVAESNGTGLGLDLALRPHVTFDQTGDIQSTRAGAELRVGQNLDLRGVDAKNSQWYVFAGADGEAVVLDMAQRGTMNPADGALSLQDKVTIGDMQAGVAFESPAGQMSISYISRDYEYRNGEIARSGNEDFAAVTLTWRR